MTAQGGNPSRLEIDRIILRGLTVPPQSLDRLRNLIERELAREIAEVRDDGSNRAAEEDKHPIQDSPLGAEALEGMARAIARRILGQLT